MVLNVSMKGEMHKVKGNISELRLNLDCVLSTTNCCIWPQIQGKRQRRERWRAAVSLFGALFLSKSAHCLFPVMQKLFSAESLTHRKPTDPSTLKPSIQDQIWETVSPISETTHLIPLSWQTSNVPSHEWISLPSVSQSESPAHISHS